MLLPDAEKDGLLDALARWMLDHLRGAKGWLVNRSRDRNYDLMPGEPLPDEVSLPTVAEVEREWLGAPDGTVVVRCSLARTWWKRCAS